MNVNKLDISTTSHDDKMTLFSESLLDSTNKITKISPNSGLYGISAGVATLLELLEKDISIFVSRINPNVATGIYLDNCCSIKGVYPRLSASKSSSVVRIGALEGTQYLKNTHTLTSTSGISFILNNDVTVGSDGYAYAGVTSVQTGSNTNVNGLSINKFQVYPEGHLYVYNESSSFGGADTEDDDSLRNRILTSNNLFSISNIELCTQIAILNNSNVYKIIKLGKNNIGQIILGVITKYNQSLSDDELLTIASKISDRLSISDIFTANYQNNIILKNVDKKYVDISFKCQISKGYQISKVVQSIQNSIHLYFNPLNFEKNNPRVEWDNILDLVKNTEGIQYVDDSSFKPNIDIKLNINNYPVLRGFQIFSLNGDSLLYSDTVSSYYYENIKNNNFQKTVIYK